MWLNTRLNVVQIYQLEKEGKPRVYPNRGDTIKEALVHNQNEPDFWTQYNRTHGLLAAIRGNGEPLREYPNRTAYNIFTGRFIKQTYFNFFIVLYC